MDEIAANPPIESPEPVSAPEPTGPLVTSLRSWIVEGLRAAFLLRPRVSGPAAPWQVLVVLLLTLAIETALARLEVPGSAAFNVRGLILPWWSAGAMLLTIWWLLWGLRPEAAIERPQGVAAWFALWLLATLPMTVLDEAMNALSARGLMPQAYTSSPLVAWGIYLGIWSWMLAVAVVLGRHVGLGRYRLAALAVALLSIWSVSATYATDRPWYSDAPDVDERPRFSLSQESFEAQQLAWKQSVAALAPQRAGVRDVYGLVFAPYASEDVFLRESTMVAELLAQRFDAQGRVLHLVNHASTSERLPWATPLNLRRAIEALARQMDREQDVLVVYLTSHGASNFKLAASHWPLKVDSLNPADLRRMLDEAGIRHRVIAISACYAGGWIGPLASDTSLVMTAADPDHTSYGCGRRSELTFFGRAVFDEQLRKTHSFEQAFAAAVPVIRQRENEAGKSDGFSNPQISVGEKIRPVLDEIAQRLDKAAQL
jgi:hypothetical protein